MKQFTLIVLTPEGGAFQGAVEHVEVPAVDGRMGILADHAALVARLGSGEIRARVQPGRQVVIRVDGGFLQVFRNEAVVLTAGAALL